jgi:hypothetical protein
VEIGDSIINMKSRFGNCFDNGNAACPFSAGFESVFHFGLYRQI